MEHFRRAWFLSGIVPRGTFSCAWFSECRLFHVEHLAVLDFRSEDCSTWNILAVIDFGSVECSTWNIFDWWILGFDFGMLHSVRGVMLGSLT